MNESKLMALLISTNASLGAIKQLIVMKGYASEIEMEYLERERLKEAKNLLHLVLPDTFNIEEVRAELHLLLTE